jgi:hypothetical protein
LNTEGLSKLDFALLGATFSKAIILQVLGKINKMHEKFLNLDFCIVKAMVQLVL